MKTILLSNYSANVLRAILSLKVVDKDIPEPGKDEVLVKLHAAAVNPSDIAFIQGGYNIVKPLPATPGFEGSGTIVEAASGLKNLIGKKISCFVQNDEGGTWSEYFTVHKDDLILLDDRMDMDQAACFTVNPFTGYGLINIALMRESTAVIQNAAGGQVPGFVRTLAKENGMEVINIVRKPATAERLVKEGCKHVLTEQDADFKEKLKTLARELNATTAFDAVGGVLSGNIFNAMPGDSELVVYGGLSGKPMSGIDTMDVIFNDKIVSGFNLIDWKNELDKNEFVEIVEELQQKFINGEMKTNIRESIQFEDIVRGLKEYIGNMSSGKILIKP
ncbi:MAG: zinc-binding dehydrogenase [Chlorobi bacterium]|nr:zinc-binding dehydrogenase [Chlorobiota bacterium]